MHIDVDLSEALGDRIIEIDKKYMDPLCKVALHILREEGVTEDCLISLSIVTDDKIHAINKKHRHVDRATDVLSFPQFESREEIMAEAYPLLGDIVISLETAERQAEEYGHSLMRELCFLMAHAMLHLLGYDHMSEAEEKEMVEKQESVLTALGHTRLGEAL